MNQASPEIEAKYQALCVQLGHQIHIQQKTEHQINALKAQLVELQKEYEAEEAAKSAPKKKPKAKK